MKKIREEKAITLVALVITIVILIILAGITMSISLGNGGLFKRAKNSQIAYEIGLYKDKLESRKAECFLEKEENPSLQEYIEHIQDKENIKDKDIKSSKCSNG